MLLALDLLLELGGRGCELLSRCFDVLEPGQHPDKAVALLLGEFALARCFGELGLEARRPGASGECGADGLLDDLLGDVGANRDAARAVADRRAAVESVAAAV